MIERAIVLAALLVTLYFLIAMGVVLVADWLHRARRRDRK